MLKKKIYLFIYAHKYLHIRLIIGSIVSYIAAKKIYIYHEKLLESTQIANLQTYIMSFLMVMSICLCLFLCGYVAFLTFVFLNEKLKEWLRG